MMHGPMDVKYIKIYWK